MGESKRKEEYFCFPEHYCSCHSFFYDIVKNGRQLFVSTSNFHFHYFSSFFFANSFSLLFCLQFYDEIFVMLSFLHIGYACFASYAV